VDRQYDARVVLKGLVGTTIRTLTGRPNTVVALEGDQVRVATTRSPKGTLVPVKWVQDALDRLASDGEVEISVDSVGYRSAFVGAVLSALDDAQSSPTTMHVRWVKR
jgi:hypothetical protein